MIPRGSSIVSARNKLSRALHRNESLFFAIKYLRLRFIMWFYRNMDDRTYIERQYRSRMGKILHLEPPVLYNEKVQYRKLYDRDPRMKELADKAAVRNYVEERIGAKYLTKVYGVYDTVEEIPFDSLPERFAMKLTNGSGFNFICREKTPEEIRKIRKLFRQWLKLDFYMLGREWAYKGVKNRIICEEYLEEKDGSGLNDYKIFCFNGKPRLIQVDFDRFTNHRRNLYTPEWQFLNERVAYENDPDASLPPPPNFSEMLACAEKLSEGFSHVRVDFYDIDGRIVFGEMTFYHGAGYLRFEHEAFEKKLGDYWELE